MNIDNEIFLAKCEKLLENIWQKNYEEIFGNESTLNEAADILNIKYNKLAETLREYNYTSAINTLLREKTVTPIAAMPLKEEISTAMNNINSNSLDLIKEGYSTLSDIYSLMNDPLFENFRQFAKNPDWDEKYINLVRGRTNAYEKKHGDFRTKEERARKEDEIAQSLQHKRINKNAAKEKDTAIKLANSNYNARIRKGRSEAEASAKREEEIKNMNELIDKRKNNEKSKFVTDK